jgi:hypothetical protein
VIGLSIWEESFSKLNIKIMKVNNLPKKGMATFKIWIVRHWNFSRSTASLQHPLEPGFISALEQHSMVLRLFNF